jgi:hypothetical protein
MPFRERTAWLSLTAIALTFLPYILYVSRLPTLDAPLPNFPLMKLFALAMGGQAIMVTIGQITLRLQHREDAKAKPDERDRAIVRRSMVAAYYTLMVGTILAAIYLPFERSGWALVNAGALAVTVAETVRCIIVVVSYRRGWND